MKILGFILRFEFTVQLRVDISTRTNSCLGLFFRLNMFLLFLLIVEAFHIQLVLKKLILIKVVGLLSLFYLCHVFLYGRTNFTSCANLIRAWARETLSFFWRSFFFRRYSWDLRSTPIGDLPGPFSNLIVRFISTRPQSGWIL